MCLTKILYRKHGKHLFKVRNDEGVQLSSPYFPIIGKITHNKYTSFIDLKGNLDKSNSFIGYKVFIENNNKLLSTYSKNISLGIWHQCNYTLEYDLHGELYLAGFHIFATREDARKYKKGCSAFDRIYKVEFKDILGFGYDSVETKVILASQMKVLHKV